MFRVILALLCTIACAPAQTDAIRMLRSLAGPSGRASGSKFIFDEARNRFVYPQDKSLIVYFEWDAPPGLHVLTGIWKQPDGRVSSMSPDVKVETANRELRCYWQYLLAPGLPGGVWTLEVRVDGQPAGSHAFELVSIEQPAPAVEAAPAPRAPPTLDEIFRKTSRSLVWIYKLDESGHRTDTATGFIIEPGRIVTAFQAVDSAARIEIEFPGGRKVTVDALLAFSRNGDWAVLRADTGDLPLIPRGDPKTVAVGERLTVFNVESDARVLGGIDVGGRRTVAGFGERIQLSPGVAKGAVGGPLLDSFGRVVGVLGGSLTPGSRFDSRSMGISPALWNNLNANNAAIPVTEVNVASGAEPVSFKALLDAGTLTAPLAAMPEFMYGGTTQSLPKSATGPMPRDASEFGRGETQVYVYSLWSRKGKIGRGVLSAKVFDSGNRVVVEVAGKKMSLGEIPVRSAFGFSPAGLRGGTYRVDLLWDGKPVWRTFILITE